MKIEGKTEDGNLLLSNDLIITEQGKALKGVCGLLISVDPGDIVRASLKLYLERLDLRGAGAEYVIQDPETGELLPIKTLELKDGRFIIRDGELEVDAD